MDVIEEARKVFDVEINALVATRDAINETFEKILKLITECKGKVVITGIGKPRHIAAKIAATFASLGTPAFCLDAAHALHGDLGMICQEDVVLAISFSGESEEVLRMIPGIKLIGAKLVGITGNKNSTLAKLADEVQVLPQFSEACYLGLAPTSSTTVELCYGDALAVVASSVYGFDEIDFGKYHPAGALGKKLILKVDDLMVKENAIPKIKSGQLLMLAITEMTNKKLGVVSVIDENNNLVGVITDGDLRRAMEKKIDIYNVIVDEVMTKNPKVISKENLAVVALQFLKENNINNLPVIDDNSKLIGTITWQMIIKAGIIL